MHPRFLQNEYFIPQMANTNVIHKIAHFPRWVSPKIKPDYSDFQTSNPFFLMSIKEAPRILQKSSVPNYSCQAVSSFRKFYVQFASWCVIFWWRFYISISLLFGREEESHFVENFHDLSLPLKFFFSTWTRMNEWIKLCCASWGLFKWWRNVGHLYKWQQIWTNGTGPGGGLPFWFLERENCDGRSSYLIRSCHLWRQWWYCLYPSPTVTRWLTYATLSQADNENEIRWWWMKNEISSSLTHRPNWWAITLIGW